MENDFVSNNIAFYRGKRVFVTGHTGFKGAWLTIILHYLEANVMGFSLAPEPECLYGQIDGDKLLTSVTGDILDQQSLERSIQSFQPEIIIHLAAFGFMKECFDNPVKAYRTNLDGSMNLLEAVRKCSSVKSVILVSTDKVYENKGDGAIYREEDQLGGENPYSCSKACMEIMARDYRENYFMTDERKIGIATARASNVLAGGDHVRTRLIPSILEAVDNGTTVELRNPNQTRPWQSAFDALNGYLTIARYLYRKPDIYSGAWNIGPTKDGIRSVGWVMNRIQHSFGSLKAEVGEKFRVRESETLGLDIGKTVNKLDWYPMMGCEEVVDEVVEFYRRSKAGEPAYDICMSQVENYYGGR